MPLQKTAAVKLTQQKSRLYLNDWLKVVAYADANPHLKHKDIVQHFATCIEGALFFDQSSLSRHLSKQGREKDALACIQNQNALNQKKRCIVTRLDVDKALYLWFMHMEQKNEVVTGPMLMAKCEKFESSMDVPENEKLRSDGWIKGFKLAYGIKEYRKHGEAGSVDEEAVKVERKRLAVILAEYEKKDQWNFDETGLLGAAPPTRGLATKKLAGKKASKFRLTLGLACNADGTETLPIFFIGKSKCPRDFGKKSGAELGFYYRNNKTAWMDSFFFNEWIQEQDRVFCAQNRKIILLLDNFKGHLITYKPTNIRIEFFAGNMTSYVQPLDAGIIRCFKALYRKAYCLRALEKDEIGEENIYGIKQLEIMLLAKEAWAQITIETRRNCWRHTNINGEQESLQNPLHNQDAWNLMLEFASRDDIPAPIVEKKLQKLLQNQYNYDDWKPVFDAVFRQEQDTELAVTSVRQLMKNYTSVAPEKESISQLQEAEIEISNSIDNLEERNRIWGSKPTLDDLLDPVEERRALTLPYDFPGGDTEIIQTALKNLGEERRDNNDRSDTDSDLDETKEKPSQNEEKVTLKEGMKLCEQLEKLSLEHCDADGVSVVELGRQLQRLRAHLSRVETTSLKQRSLDDFF